ncbi:DNA utilization protein GntX [Candidatus Arcanobacter lacustris]|uniref:DNA utilization protein GntX n=1 Tax=Candidatus Arcanibacter lacustris TaxID=1607817 RepID=A0A0F5MQ67_9RICK|nr:DNA utilization protein GntX [Candidatus Arcanobacter lacustris]
MYWRKILDLIFPPKCLICGSLIASMPGLCSNCWANINFISKPACAKCNLPFEYDFGEDVICGACTASKPLYHKAKSVFIYDDFSKPLLHGLKYQDKTHLAPYLASLMRIAAGDLLSYSDIIIPVPLHKKKLLSRLYNQSALLSLYLHKSTKIPFEPNLLIKHKNTKTQTGLTKKQRLSNIKGSFMINEKFIYQVKDKNIMLVDDVITTGATINACTRLLLKYGANKVNILTLART